MLQAAQARQAAHQILAFYYGWWGNPATSAAWVHWQGVDAADERVGNAADYPVGGAYDSHDPATLERQAAQARAAGIDGFIASWWGQGSFEDKGIPLLLAAAAKQGIAVSAYYETIAGADAASRERAAIADLDYLLQRYGNSAAWLKAGGKPVLFIYGRALGELAPYAWHLVLAKVRGDNPGGAVFIADSLDPRMVGVFDGASTYNVTGQTRRKTPAQLQLWAHAAYPAMVAAAGPAKISTVTVIPGYDDRHLGRPPPRPVTDRYGGMVYRALWQEAIRAAPDWVLITSWNEWHEGSEIEPSVQYGSLFLDMTREFSRRFHASRGAPR